MELQTLLRRTREESGQMQIFIQEQFRFLQQQSQPGAAGTPSTGMFASGVGGGTASAPRFAAPSALPLTGSWPPGAISRTPGFGLRSGMGSGGLTNPADYLLADGLGVAPLTSTSDEGEGGGFASPTFDYMGVGTHDLQPFRPLSSDVELTSGASS